MRVEILRSRAVVASLALLGALLLSIAVAPTLGATTGAGESGSAGSTTDALTIDGLPTAPEVDAPAWAVYDGVDGTRLAGRAAEEARPIASLTKIMTALVVTKRTRGDERVQISERATRIGDGAGLGVRPGQRYTVDALLRAMLVYSANDAALALAEHVASTEDEFLELMRDEAASLELDSAAFHSVTGLPPSGDTEETVASPADLVELAQVAMREPRIREAVRSEEVTIKRPGSEPAILGNRNLLLGDYAGVDGVKTGHTDDAGYCLLTHYDDAEDRELWVVVLGESSEDARVRDTRRLLDWAVPLRQTASVLTAGDPVATAPVAGRRQRVGLFVSDDVSVSVRVGERVRERIVAASPVEPPLREGDELGRIEIVVDGEVMGRSPLYVDRTLRAVDTWDRVRDAATDWRTAAREGWEEVDRRVRRLRDDLAA